MMFRSDWDSEIECSDCLYRKYDMVINGEIQPGAFDSSCAMYIPKPHSIYHDGKKCKFYRKQSDGEELVWGSELKGKWWYQPLLDDQLKRLGRQTGNQ